MKKLNQHLLLAATMMLMAGSAYAQSGPGPKPTNTYDGPAVRTERTPTNTHQANPEVAGAPAGTYSKDYSVYSQDSYVSQTGSNNYATVDQSNTSGSTVIGNTAIIDQTGSNNNATQIQSATGRNLGNGSYFNSGPERNYAKVTQDGSSSQANQSQYNGIANRMTVLQGANTTGNRAIQTQGSTTSNSIVNQATIAQTKYAVAGGGSGNRAEQSQTGALQLAKIEQEGINSYAKQTQTASGAPFDNNSAYIHQGDPGTGNTAIQSQGGSNNTARIQQGIGGTANNSYAMQTQTGTNNQASIDQFLTNNSYAEQVQSNNNNYSGMTQSNVRSAAYSIQTGANNAAIVTQH